MAFERYEQKGSELDRVCCCSVGRSGRISISRGLTRDLDFIPVSVSVFFDREAETVGLVLHNDKPVFAYKLSGTDDRRTTYYFQPMKFLKEKRIAPGQLRIPATIQQVDGQNMIVFPVKMEASNGP